MIALSGVKYLNSVDEKLRKFSFMIMREADERKKEIISEAERENRALIEKEEIEALKKAYEHIQEAVRDLDKELNEKVSKAVMESKHALFKRREDMIESIFQNVLTRFGKFRQSEDYKTYLEDLIDNGLKNIGQGQIQVFADSDDLPLVEKIRDKAGLSFEVLESEEKLFGGLIIVNSTKGILLDRSVKSKLADERENFLERYGLSIE